MKTIPTNEQIKPLPKMRYEDALNHIEVIYGKDRCGFNESCVCSFEYAVHDRQITGCWMTYDKISVSPEGQQEFYWPIQSYKEQLINGEKHDFYEKFKGRKDGEGS